jgi:hypothetical protein
MARLIAGCILLTGGFLWGMAAEFGQARAGLIDPLEDPDNDGCTTAEELGSDPVAGGEP